MNQNREPNWKRAGFFAVIFLIICGIMYVTLVMPKHKKISHEESEVTSNLAAKEQTEVNSEEENTESESSVSAEVDLPDGFRKASDEELLSIPDSDDLITEGSKILSLIGVEKVDNVIYGNYKSDTSNSITTVNLDAYTVSDIRNLIVSFMYLKTSSNSSTTPKWSISYVMDADTRNYYYVPDELKNTVDLYDYNTGEVISEKSETSEDVQERIDQDLDEAEEEFEEKLDDLKENQGDITSREISELLFEGESIIDVTVNDMKQYDYISDIYIEVDEGKDLVSIVVQVPSSTDVDTAKMAGEDVSRYLAFCASCVNSYFSTPGSDDIGGIYEKYDLLIYIDDGNQNLNIYGAKVTTAKEITWRL